jgi:hypothetical protein
LVSGSTDGLGPSPSIDVLVVRKVQSVETPRPGVVVTEEDFVDPRVSIAADRHSWSRDPCMREPAGPAHDRPVKDVILTVVLAIVLAIGFMYLLLSLAFAGWGDRPPPSAIPQPVASAAPSERARPEYSEQITCTNGMPDSPSPSRAHLRDDGAVVAPPDGFEPPTPALGRLRSIH